uniref:Uncharacterized protein n=1 Tax=Anopheles stephensi TaxID=30069 RepID=A0A182Y646_ANOST
MNNSVSGSGGGGGTTMGTGGSGGTGNMGSNENSVSSGMLNSSSSANSISRKSASSSASGGGGGGGASHGGAGGGIGGATGAGGKTSSFTITSVIVGPGKHSADNGDDSADDLDESHTDDNSRITDFENETPSFSEDTFSKEDVFFTNAIGSVPVIPTSSQYGLAIVAPNDRTHGGEVLADAMHVSVTDGGINIMGHGKGEMSDGKELHHRNERFKVVKIESTEPFKRGRWVCMDYLDHTTLQQPKEISTGAEGNDAGGGTNASVTTQDSGVGMNDNASFAPSDGTTTGEMGNVDYHPNAVSSSSVVVGSSVATSTSTNTASNVSSVVLGMLNNESPGQSLNLSLAGGNSGGAAVTAGNTTSHVQSNATGPGTGTVGGAQGIPHSLPQSQLQNALAGQQQQQQPNAAYSQAQQGQSQYYPHTMTNLADLSQQSVSNPQAHQHHQHGATLPSNMQMHPQQPPPQQQQQQQQQQQPNNTAVPSSNILPPLVAPIPTSQEMNIIINNPTIQSSFPSPHQQFKPQQPPQQAASQTNSPVVVPTSLIDNTTVPGVPGESVPLNSANAGTNILSPSAGSGNAVSALSTTGGVSAHDTAGSVSIATDPMMNASPSATSSPVTSSGQIIPQSTAFAPAPGAGASATSIGDPSTVQNTAAPNSVTGSSNNSNAAVGGSTTTNGGTVAAGSPSSNGAIGSTNTIPVAPGSGNSVADQLSSEAKLLSAVSGVTTGTVSGDGEDPDKANAEDGER